MITPLNNFVIVEVDKEHKDTITADSGFKLDLIPGCAPGEALHQVREYGKVVAVPNKLSDALNTTMDLIIGERVYFHFHTVNPDNRYFLDGKTVFKVMYSEIYCSIRKDKIHMMNHYVLVSPIMDVPKDVKTKFGLYTRSDVDEKPVKHRGKIEHKRFDCDDFKEGDEIFYSRLSDVLLNVEGVVYYRMVEDDILCTVLN